MLISRKPGLITTNDPIKPIVTAVHLLNPPSHLATLVKMLLLLMELQKLSVNALAREIIDIA